MAISAARRAAFEILVRVERDRAYASELLNAARLDALSRADRALTHELVLSALRWQAWLDARLARYANKNLAKFDVEVRVALRLGACQLLLLDRIPAHAAVDESVELVKRAGKRSASGMVNAVLRKLAAEPKLAVADDGSTCALQPAAANEPATLAAELAAEFSHPLWLVRRWIDMYQYSATRAICAADQQPSPAALRWLGTGASTLRDEDSTEVDAALTAAGVRLAPGLLLREARRLLSGELTKTAAFRTGRVAVQDEGSQLIAALLGQGERILDCCAAPGGKTLLLAARNPTARIVAAELHERRAEALKLRVRALGDGFASHIEVCAGDVRSMQFAQPFDRVLADVPCSGSGTLGANPEIRWRLAESHLKTLAELQTSILEKALSWLAVGGRLVYSTCSLEAEEGEAVVERVLGSRAEFRLLDCGVRLEELQAAGELVWAEPRSLVRGPFLRTCPGVHPCEGFFAALIERRSPTTTRAVIAK